MSGTGVARVFAETSLDGITWDTFGGEQGLISAGIDETDNPSGSFRVYAAGTALSDAPFVRLGVQIERTGAQADLRLTIVATPKSGGGSMVLAFEEDAMSLGVDDPVGPIFATADMAALVLSGITTTGFFPTGADLMLELYTGSNRIGLGPSNRSAVPTASLTLMEGNLDTINAFLNADNLALSDYAQLRVTSIATQPTSGEFSIDMTVRTRS